MAGSDSGGGAGIQADLKTITVLGAFGTSVITALTVQNTLGVQAVYQLPPEFVAAQMEAVLSDIGADAVKTGMLAGSVVVQTVAAKLREYRVPHLVVDPVLVTKSGQRLLQTEAFPCLVRDLLPLAEVVTPNLPEAEELLGRPILSSSDMVEAARAIQAWGPKAVLLKGGHLPGPAVDVLFDGRECLEFSAPRRETNLDHGTGCTLSTALATYLAQGLELPQAVERAKEFVTLALRRSRPLGRGHGPLNHLCLIEEKIVLDRLGEAGRILCQARSGSLVPEVQMNLGFALAGAETPEEVAAFPGRLVHLADDIVVVAPPRMGASRHLARIILTTMRFDPTRRAAINLRYDQTYINKARELGLLVAEFDRSQEPLAIKACEGSSLEWGVRTVMEKTGQVPDLIYDLGEWGKEPMLRLLGQDPVDVVKVALKIKSLME